MQHSIALKHTHKKNTWTRHWSMDKTHAQKWSTWWSFFNIIKAFSFLCLVWPNLVSQEGICEMTITSQHCVLWLKHIISYCNLRSDILQALINFTFPTKYFWGPNLTKRYENNLKIIFQQWIQTLNFVNLRHHHYQQTYLKNLNLAEFTSTLFPYCYHVMLNY